MLVVLSLLCGYMLQCPAGTPPPDSIRVARLAALGRLWATVKVFHPYLLSRRIDWDSALVAAIPQVNGAGTGMAYRATVERMLSALGDPATRIEEIAGVQREDESEPAGSWAGDSVWVIRLRSPAAFVDFANASARLAAMADSVTLARGVVLDLRLRGPPDDPTSLRFILEESGLFRRFFRDTIEAPSTRGRMYAGLPPSPGETSSGGYFAGWYTMRAARVVPSDSGRSIPLAIIANHFARLSPEALALIESRRAWLVLEGADGDASATETVPVALTDGLVAQVRLTELVPPDGSVGWVADTVVAAGAPDDAVIQAAVRRLTSGTPMRHRWRSTAVGADPIPERAYDDTPFPRRELRLLGAFRMWSVVRWFYPYRDLMHEDWDDVLFRFIPRLESVSDSLEYALTVAEMWTHIRDSHGFIENEILTTWLGVGWPPVGVRMIEGVPTVVAFTNDSVARANGFRIGDVILNVDDEPVKRRFNRLRRVARGGTPRRSHATSRSASFGARTAP